MVSDPSGLTVNSDKNVLVVIECERKLKQFTTHGTQLQTIQLQPDIDSPRQAIQLSGGQFVISHRGGTQHRVSLVDDKGAVVRSFGGTPGSDLMKMNEPDTKLKCMDTVYIDSRCKICMA